MSAKYGNQESFTFAKGKRYTLTEVQPDGDTNTESCPFAIGEIRVGGHFGGEPSIIANIYVSHLGVHILMQSEQYYFLD